MIVWFLLGSTLAGCLVIALYRLLVHPLKKVPGPRLAAVTGLYEVFWIAWSCTSYDEEIDRMHQIYGPIVRINPDEIHIQDDFYQSKGANLACHPRHLESSTQSWQWQTPATLDRLRRWSLWKIRSPLHAKMLGFVQHLVQKHHHYNESRRRAATVASSSGNEILGIRLLLRYDQSPASDLEGGTAARTVPGPVRGRSLSVAARHPGE
ncbi:Uncharacterized protein PECH_008183 [Penicillium ucsense]|uniref:Cytochrome P450 n=1 Tax=Penicillium ucsense TaxID=2839758 RepID=A0A8J8WGS0_9EURO|nr:Uncharacterized protein PECM_000612 [Penicillium ucsense]KAF7734387.1 Uncharacterized protein PECH_008183 [Penicillium ucsense]